MDPDQLASEKPADLESHCFQNIRFSMVRNLAILRLALYIAQWILSTGYPTLYTPICPQISEKFQVIS